MAVHAKIGPSSLYRLLACVGSYNLTKDLPEGASSIYAATGTLAHTLGEDCIRHDLDPATFLGTKHEVEGFQIEVDEDMVEAIDVYISFAQDLIAKTDQHWLERRVHLDPLWGPQGAPEPIFGTADLMAYQKKARHLYVGDYKHGVGVPVEVEDNPQLLAYALGAALDLPDFPLTVTITVIQPRAPHALGPIRSVTYTGLDLLSWGHEVLVPGVERMIEGGNLTTGTHCRFCPGRARCPALRKLAADTAREDFAPVPPEPNIMSDDELGHVLNRAEVLAAWIEAIRAEASARIDRGGKVPNWKLVPKRAVRTWKDEKQAGEELVSHGLPEVDLFKKKLKSPAQVQKLDPKVYEQIAGTHVDGTSSGSTLVADKDPREALKTGPRADFEALE